MESNLPNSNKKPPKQIPGKLALMLVTFVYEMIQGGQMNYHWLRLDVNDMIVKVQKDIPELKDVPLKKLHREVTLIINMAMVDACRN